MLEQMTEEERIAWEKVMPLVNEIERRTKLYGCTIAHAYERIKFEKKAKEAYTAQLRANELRRLSLEAVEEMNKYEGRK